MFLIGDSMNIRSCSPLVALGLASALGGCGLFGDDALRPQDANFDFDVGIDTTGGTIGPDGRPIFGGGVGTECATNAACRAGTVCESGACAPAGDVADGALCSISAECAPGLSCQLGSRCGTLAEINPSGGPCMAPSDCSAPQVCRPSTRCAPSGATEAGRACADPTECGPGLRCNFVGFTGLCEPEGNVDLGGECTTSADCFAPLGCAANGTCQNFVFGGIEFMPDARCEDVREDSRFEVYFEVPRDRPLNEFYRLPFPNDARVRNGQLDMSGHHNPGLQYLGGEIVDLYLQAVEENFEGFSTNPTVFFRFSRPVNFDTLRGQGENQTLYFVDIDPDSPGYGSPQSIFWSVTTGRGKFICHNFLAIHPAWGAPLRPSTTYAVILTDGLRAGNGDLPTPSGDLNALLGPSSPSDAALRDAWQSWAPLRAWLASDEAPLDSSRIAGATVFTTLPVEPVFEALRATIREQAPPTLDNLTLCGPGITSPCADGAERACIAADGSFVQVHATYEAPIWQEGSRPYLRAGDGGDVMIREGRAVPQGTESICLAMTIPTAPMPEDGWPVVMYGHGTGGSFLSFLREGIARQLADVNLGPDRRVRFVTVGIDGVQHGPRRGASEIDPEPLFYNFANPAAGRGNVRQGAADFFLLTHLLENVDLTAGESPTGEAIRFNPEQIFFFGHSQGAQVGAPFARFERGLRGVVFSGAGGGLPPSLLNKSEPVDIATGVRLVLGDGNPNANVSDTDPFLSILQWHVDPVDPLNFGRGIFRNLDEGVTPINTFMSFGFRDNYSPEPNQRYFALAMQIPLANPSPGDLRGYPDAPYPVSANQRRNGGEATTVMVPAEPGDFDGHFVIFRVESLNRQMREFLATAVLDDAPTVSAP